MKKFVVLIISVIMGCALFSGCASISQESFDDVTSQNASLQSIKWQHSKKLE